MQTPKQELQDLRTLREVIEGKAELAGKDVKGDTQVITQFTDAFLKLAGNYAVEMEMTLLDVFLAINNLHKFVIADLAARWAIDGTAPEQTYRMADQQFHHAMRELAYPGQGQLSRKQRRANGVAPRGPQTS